MQVDWQEVPELTPAWLELWRRIFAEVSIRDLDNETSS